MGDGGASFLSNSEMLCPNLKVRIRLIVAGPKFYMISDNRNFGLESVDCSLDTRRIALKDDCHRKRMEMLAYAPMQLVRDTRKNSQNLRLTKSVQSKQHFKKCSYSGIRNSKEYHLRIHWFFHRKPIWY